MFKKLKEKLEQHLEKLKGKVPGLKPVIEQGDKVTEKLLEKFGDTPEKAIKRKRLFRKIKNTFSIRNMAMCVGVIISIPGLVFFIYSSIDYYRSNNNELGSIEYITIANVNYATKYMVHRLNTQKTTRKDVRKIIKELNGLKEFGDRAKLGPCDDGNLAFSESVKPGAAILQFDPYEYAFILEGYNCDANIIASNVIRLKRPPRKKIKKTPKKEPLHGRHKEHSPQQKNSDNKGKAEALEQSPATLEHHQNEPNSSIESSHPEATSVTSTVTHTPENALNSHEKEETSVQEADVQRVNYSPLETPDNNSVHEEPKSSLPSKLQEQEETNIHPPENTVSPEKTQLETSHDKDTTVDNRTTQHSQEEHQH